MGRTAKPEDSSSFPRVWELQGEAVRSACAVDCVNDQDFLMLSPKMQKMAGPVVTSVWLGERRAGHRLRTGVTLIVKEPVIAEPAHDRYHGAPHPSLDRPRHCVKAWATDDCRGL